MYQKSGKNFFKHLDFAIIDMFAIIIAYLMAFTARFGVQTMHDTFLHVQNGMGTEYWSFLQILIIVDLIVIMLCEPYANILKRNMAQETKAIFMYNIYLWLGCMLMLYLFRKGTTYSRPMVLGAAVLSLMIMFGYRCPYKNFLRKCVNKRGVGNKMLLVVSMEDAADMVAQLNNAELCMVKVSGIIYTQKREELEPSLLTEEVAGVPVVGAVDELFEYARTHVVDEVLICGEQKMAEALTAQLREMGITVHICVNDMIHIPRASFNKINGVKVITSSIRTVAPRQMFIKRMVDICFGLIGAVATIILTIFIAPAIWIADPGPVFFSQERVGRNGRIFKIWKFRSMYQDAEARKAELMSQNKMSGQMFKMDDDPRIIGYGKKFSLGKFLRESSIDELPQSFNILFGSMSVVGTRPPTVGETNLYELHHKGRLATKPGLTGMWQVSGRSSVTDFEEVVRLDKEYIENFSLMLDLEIMLKTVKVVLGKDGSV